MAQARPPLPEDDKSPGGPLDGQTPPETTSPEPPVVQTPPTGTVIRIGTREFTVDPEVAAELERDRREWDRKFGDQGRELGELRTWRRQVEQRLPPSHEAQEYDYNTQLFERPKETLDRFGRELEQRLESRYTAAETQRRNWERFYKDHPDLADEDRLVRVVTQELLQREEWQTSDNLSAFFPVLATEVRQELLRISRKTREGEAPSREMPRGRAAVEGSGGRRTTATEEPPARVSTITGIVQDLQASKKRKAVAE
jgi:hypothetical protein